MYKKLTRRALVAMSRRIPLNHLIMRLILFLILINVHVAVAVGYAQRINMDKKHISLRDALRELRKQSDYNIIVDGDLLKKAGAIDVNLKNASLTEALSSLLEGQKLGYEIYKKNVVIKPIVVPNNKTESRVSAPIVQQQREVKGEVVDANGTALAGVSVSVKGKSSATATDDKGAFSLAAQPGDMLVFSSVGYADQEVLVGSAAVHVVLVTEDASLDEVVVVGFGTQKKVNLTGAVGTVSAKELESRPVTSATQALQGLVPGLKISTNSGDLSKDMSVSVRGTGTIGSSSGSPLILIDGMEGDLNAINPQDIENISILKDAASSSIYGSRAPFGVILVTTKSGKNGRISINYNTNLRNASPINVPETMDSYTFAVMLNSARRNEGVQPFFSDETMQKMLDFQAGKLTGGLDPDVNNPNSWADIWSQGYANTDIYDATYKSNIFAQEHNLSATGGSEKVNYYASFNYLDQGGLLEIGKDGMKRYNVMGKINAKLTDWLDFSYTTRFTRKDMTRPSAISDGFYSSFERQSWPNIPIYDANGYFHNFFFSKNLIDFAEGGQRNEQNDKQYHQGSFTIEPIKNWITKVDLNYSIENSDAKSATIPTYAHDVHGNLIDTKKNSSLYQAGRKQNYLNFNAYSTYSHTLHEAHNFKAMIGFQAEEMKLQYLSVSKNGLLLPELPEFDLTTGLQGNGNPIDAAISGYSNEWTTAGFFGRLNYDYKGRYLAEVNMRYDGSSRFRQGSRWQASPSFSLGWNIAQEDFWRDYASIANLLKLRFSYGRLGNQNTNALYPTYRVMNLGSLNGGWLQNGLKPNTAAVGALVSNSLTWESVSSWNLGLDYGFFDNRLTGAFDYFSRSTKNMVGPAPELPATLGIGTPQTNNTDLTTSGWELTVGWNDLTEGGFHYGVNVNLSDQITTIDAYPSNKTKSLSTYISGQQDGLIWGYETIGIAKSQEEMDAHLATLPNGGQTAIGTQWAAGDIMYRDLNGDGKISAGNRTLDDHGDLKVLGDSYSHYFFGVDLTAAYKGFDFRAFLQGVLKHDVWPTASSYFWGVLGDRSIWYSMGLKQHNDYFRAEPEGLPGHEIPANLDSYFPRAGTSNDGKNQQTQTRYLQNGRYLRLKNLQLGYSLPTTFLDRMGIANCRVYVSGENLLTFTPLFDVFDPETITGGWGGNAYPLSRTWSMGLSVTF